MESNPIVRLNIGSGQKVMPGFLNLDAQTFPGVTQIEDARHLPFETGTVDYVYACHILEHFGRWETEAVLGEWVRVLKPGGLIRVSVPDFDAVVRHYRTHGRIDDVMGLLCGGQRNSYDHHGCVFNEDRLHTLLRAAGLTWVRRYDWRATEHANVDDYSQAYLPHLDKEGGMHMSLNMEGRRPDGLTR